MEPEKEIKPDAIQTYADDMAKVIGENTEAGLVKKIIHEEQAYELAKMDQPPQVKRNKLFMWSGATLLVLAFATIAFLLFKNDINTIEVEKQFVPLIFTDKSVFLDISGLGKDEIAQTVLNEVNTTSVKSKGIEGIYLTENKQIIGLRKFIFLLKSNFVPGNNTLFVSDNFLLGVMNNDTKDFFILLKVRSHADIFENLRAWENKMFTDLHGFFGVDISTETNYLLTKNFEDGIVGNKNARILYRNADDESENLLRAENGIVLMYVFADDTSVIIANSEKVAKEIMLRAASGETKE